MTKAEIEAALAEAEAAGRDAIGVKLRPQADGRVRFFSPPSPAWAEVREALGMFGFDVVLCVDRRGKPPGLPAARLACDVGGVAGGGGRGAGGVRRLGASDWRHGMIAEQLEEALADDARRRGLEEAARSRLPRFLDVEVECWDEGDGYWRARARGRGVHASRSRLRAVAYALEDLARDLGREG